MRLLALRTSRSALTTNQEVVLGLTASDPRFDELAVLFSEYWNDDDVKVLTTESVESYREIFNQHKDINKEISEMEGSIKKKIGDFNFSNINRGSKKKNKMSIFQGSYSKSYQESVTAYNNIEAVFRERGRKVHDNVIPLRLEIDSFFSFVRDRHATHETWKDEPLGWNEIKKAQLRNLIDEWISISWPHFENDIVTTNYPLILSLFGSEEALINSSIEDLVGGLVVLHSFHDRLRFYKGGIEILKKKFLESNEPENIRKSFMHLLYGNKDIVSRMSDLIYSENFKLDEFGQANVQELVGWINQENLPVINGRTTKVMRYFGFDVKQL